jgi:hypothetical protein
MSSRNRQGDWGEYSGRARQPLAPGGTGQRRRNGQQRPGSVRRDDYRDYPDPTATRGSYQQPGARMPQSRLDQPNGGRRSRLVAILVLLVAAVIVTIGGIAASQSSSSAGSGATVSISILPFPQNTVTTATQ